LQFTFCDKKWNIWAKIHNFMLVKIQNAFFLVVPITSLNIKKVNAMPITLPLFAHKIDRKLCNRYHTHALFIKILFLAFKVEIN